MIPREKRGKQSRCYPGFRFSKRRVGNRGVNIRDPGLLLGLADNQILIEFYPAAASNALFAERDRVSVILLSFNLINFSLRQIRG